MRTRIAALPDGCYRHEPEIDGYLEQVWLRTQVTVEGDEIEVNFAGHLRPNGDCSQRNWCSSPPTWSGTSIC